MARLPSAADVQTISPRIAADPGLRAPAQAFESETTIAAQELAPAADKFAEVAARQQNRADAVESSGIINSKNEENDTELRRLNTESDLSNTKVLEEYGSFLSQRTQKALENFNGSDAARARLTIRLQDIDAAATGRAAEASVKLGRDKVDKAYNDALGPLGERAAQNPTLENINKTLGEVPVALDDLSGAYRDPSEEQVQLKIGQEHVVTSAVDRLIIQGRAEEAESLLVDGGMNRFLSLEKQRETRRRIDNVFESRKEAARAAQTALLVERAKLQARRENISLILGDARAPVILSDTENVIDTPAVSNPFGQGVDTTQDMQDAVRMFTASRRLLLGGESQLANGLLSQARFIVENSPEIQREKELDKPISEDLASELGVPIGTTLRSVMSVIPASPEEQAESRAAAAARGKQRIGGEEQIAFIDEASTVVRDLLEELKDDPTLVGVGGSLRATGQTVLGVLGDLGARKLVSSARELAFQNTDLGLDDMTKLFDSSTLSVLSIMENSIGMILARLRTPSGRIPVDVIKRSIDDVNLTGLKSSKQVQNRLNFVLQQLDRRAEAIEGRFGLPSKSQDTTIGIPRFRVKGGKLVPVDNKQITTPEGAP